MAHGFWSETAVALLDLVRRLGRVGRLAGRPAPPAAVEADEDVPAGAPLWAIVPPAGVTLVETRPSKTGEGGRGLLARYSDGTTASVMLNSDGSVRVLFFRGQAAVPAVVAGSSGDDGGDSGHAGDAGDHDGPVRYTWEEEE